MHDEVNRRLYVSFISLQQKTCLVVREPSAEQLANTADLQVYRTFMASTNRPNDFAIDISQLSLLLNQMPEKCLNFYRPYSDRSPPSFVLALYAGVKKYVRKMIFIAEMVKTVARLAKNY